MPTDALETFKLPSQYGLTAERQALGNVRIPHGGGIDEFGKFDSPFPRYTLTMKFTGIRELEGALDPDNGEGPLPELRYLYGFFDRHVSAGRKIFIVPGIINGMTDTVQRLYTFKDDNLSLDAFSIRLWSGTVSMIQHGTGDFGPSDLIVS